MRPIASAHASLQPYMITQEEDQTRTGQRNDGIYTVGDAKNALDIPPEDDTEDVNVLLWLEEAQATVEKMTGLNLSPQRVTAEFVNQTGNRYIQCLELTESDFSAITSVTECSSTGALNTLDPNGYETFRAISRYYIRRTDGRYFPHHCGVVAKVCAVRRILAGTNTARLVRGAMNNLMRDLANGYSSSSPSGFADNPAFIRAIRLLKSKTSTARVM